MELQPIQYTPQTMVGVFQNVDKKDAPGGFFHTLNNIIRTENGLAKRNGFSCASAKFEFAEANIFSNSQLVRFDFVGTDNVIVRYLLIFSQQTNAFKLSIINLNLSATVLNLSATEIGTTETPYVGSSVVNNNIFFKALGSKYVYYWTPATDDDTKLAAARYDISTITDYAKVWDLVEYNNLLYASGGSVGVYNDSILYGGIGGDFSAAGWATSGVQNVITLSAKRGNSIVRFFNWGDGFVLLTTSHPMMTRGSLLSTVVIGEYRADAGMNSDAPFAACRGALGIYYKGRKAIYRFNGQFSVDITTLQIPDILDAAATTYTRLWAFDRYIVYTTGATVATQKHWLYDEIDQKWVGSWTSPCLFIAMTGYEWKYGANIASDTIPDVYFLDYDSKGSKRRVFTQPTASPIKNDYYDTAAHAISVEVELPPRNFGVWHAPKDFGSINIGAKLVSTLALDAAIGIDESTIGSYASTDKFTKQIALTQSATAKDDSNKLYAAGITANYLWILPHEPSKNATGDNISLKITNSSTVDILLKYIVMSAKTNEGDAVMKRDLGAKR